MKRFLSSKKKIAILILAVLAATYAVYRPYLFSKGPCDQPCQDLGSDLSSTDKVLGPSYRPRCAPLQLSLELADRGVRVGRVYGLFYRVRLKNVSCERLTFNAAQFVYGIARSRRDVDRLNFALTGPDGKERELFNDVSYSSEFDPWLPYSIDDKGSPFLNELLKEYEPLRQPLDAHRLVTLAPGQEIETTPSKVELRCPKSRGDEAADAAGGPHTPEGRLLKRLADEFDEKKCQWALRRPNFPKVIEPPLGFRPFDDYKFDGPGKYKIRVVGGMSFSAEPIYPHAESCPSLVEFPLGFLDQFFSGKIFPSPSDERRRYEIRIESSAVEFEVSL